MIDVCDSKGMKKLDQFFQSKYEEVEEKEADTSGERLGSVALWSKMGKNTDKIAIQSFTVPRVRE